MLFRSIEELEVRFHDREKDNAYQMQRLAVRVDNTLMKISEENVKAPWERHLQEAVIGWRKELDEALAARPQMDDLTGYTTLVTTEKIVKTSWQNSNSAQMSNSTGCKVD